MDPSRLGARANHFEFWKRTAGIISLLLLAQFGLAGCLRGRAGEEEAIEPRELDPGKANEALAVDGFRYKGMLPAVSGGATQALLVYEHLSTGLEFVLIPGADTLPRAYEHFREGVRDWSGLRDEPDIWRQTTLEPFFLCRTEVTQEAWERSMGSNPSHFRGARRPVEQVSVPEVLRWCAKAGLRLPTETEWEYACRALRVGNDWAGGGQEHLESLGWFGGNSGGSTRPVGRKRMNGFGLFDMHGNVRELCFEDNVGGQDSAVREQAGPEWNVVAKGGGWDSNAGECRPGSRERVGPERSSSIGFRPAATLPESARASDSRAWQTPVGEWVLDESFLVAFKHLIMSQETSPNRSLEEEQKDFEEQRARWEEWYDANVIDSYIEAKLMLGFDEKGTVLESARVSEEEVRQRRGSWTQERSRIVVEFAFPDGVAVEKYTLVGGYLEYNNPHFGPGRALIVFKRKAATPR